MKQGWIRVEDNGTQEPLAPKTMADMVYMDGTQSETVQDFLEAMASTKLEAAAVVNNLTTTAEGYALDARQGKTLLDQISNGIPEKGKLLWEGTWSSGSITLENSDKYSVFLVQFGTWVPGIAIKNPHQANIIFLGISANSTNLYLTGYYAERTDNTWAFGSGGGCSFQLHSNTVSSSQLPAITRIYGLI